MKSTFQEPELHDVAQIFTNELAKLHTRTSPSTWITSVLELKVHFRDNKPEVKLEFCGECGTVSHTQLGALMDEVYRRSHYDEHAKLSIDQESRTLLSLPSPSDEESF